MKAIFLTIFISFFSLMYANTVIGTLELFKGNVKVKSKNSIKKSRVVVGLNIKEGDLITSAKNASAKIKLKDGSIIVLDESSSINFETLRSAEQLNGKVLYKITSRDAKNSLKIKTPFAIIGIKGTTFIVNATKEPSIKLKEGLIGITSLEEEFELYRKQVTQEFNDYMAEQDAAIKKEYEEFEKFKKEQEELYQDAKFTKEFEHKAGYTISFNGKVVKEHIFTQDDDAEFEHFKDIVNNMK